MQSRVLGAANEDLKRPRRRWTRALTCSGSYAIRISKDIQSSYLAELSELLSRLQARMAESSDSLEKRELPSLRGLLHSEVNTSLHIVYEFRLIERNCMRDCPLCKILKLKLKEKRIFGKQVELSILPVECWLKPSSTIHNVEGMLFEEDPSIYCLVGSFGIVRQCFRAED